MGKVLLQGAVGPRKHEERAHNPEAVGQNVLHEKLVPLLESDVGESVHVLHCIEDHHAVHVLVPRSGEEKRREGNLVRLDAEERGELR